MTRYINNHIHTVYSFSPYTPARAVEVAKANGLLTAGIMDHDSVAGAREFIAAGRAAELPVTVGVECRVSMAKTPYNGRRINNPDQNSVAYVAMHAIPHQNIESVDDYFAKYRGFRNERNRGMCEKISALLGGYGMSVDFERDVLPLSRWQSGGSVTERHILFALTKKINAKYRSPEKVVRFLKDTLEIPLASKNEGQILSGRETPEYYEYDILGALKSGLVEKIYIPATDECPDVSEFIAMVREFGGISAYAYLGDVGESVTGDKKPQKFEDDYLDGLMVTLGELGFDAVTYMPTRNTSEQLDRIMALCREHGFFQISGEDINSPRQSFVCKAYEDPKFAHLIDAAFSMIAYENEAENGIAAARQKHSRLFRDF